MLHDGGDRRLLLGVHANSAGLQAERNKISVATGSAVPIMMHRSYALRNFGAASSEHLRGQRPVIPGAAPPPGRP